MRQGTSVRMRTVTIAIVFVAIAVSYAVGAGRAADDEKYDVVIANGRVMDPESGLDAVRNVGISGGKIRAISYESAARKDDDGRQGAGRRAGIYRFARTWARARGTISSRRMTASPLLWNSKQAPLT